ncbi:DNA polymerase III subunit gamma/tau [Aridibaculum aurantiacum]|uniref:DNA polymerase III subunit gamma/tau n=1 Tax=Aridibaculum aurantiacum TaxID=2810307 RepID=UPI001F622BF4|nr:DNA polymerase III subunit gamma/tau [Aridibaculum aurantiacum]
MPGNKPGKDPEWQREQKRVDKICIKVQVHPANRFKRLKVVTSEETGSKTLWLFTIGFTRTSCAKQPLTALANFANLHPCPLYKAIYMEKFIVSARKYRPQNFNTVVGQSHITTTLKNAIRNEQLAHAFLFCGPRGVGKTTCARILAKTINCENLQADGEACNTCNSCKSFNDGASLNIHELDAASNNSVDDIRALVEQVRFAPQAGKYKVYIVDEVHMLSSSAFNAFLKTLEEPPSYAIFILATTEKHKILPTILSRCQIFDFKRITNNDTVEHLQDIIKKEEIQAEKAALQVIAQKSEGCMRDSLSILDKIVSFTNGSVTYQNTLEHLNILDHDYYFKLLDTQLNQDMAGAMLLYDEINRKGFEGDLVLNGYAEFIRNILVSQNPKAASLLDVVEGLEEKYQQTAKRVSPAFLVGALNILNEAEINYKMSRNKRLHVEMTLIKLSFLQQAISLTYDSETGAVVKKKRVNGPVALKFEPIRSLQIKPGAAPVPTPAPASPPAAKLYIQTQPAANQLAEPAPKPAMPAVATASATAVAAEIAEVAVAERPVPPPPAAGGKKSLLQNIRDKHLGAKGNIQVKQAIDLCDEKLQEAWQIYVERLKQQLKHSVVTVFNIARLECVNESHFSITVSTSLEQKFIDGEKLDLLEHLKSFFNNRNIGYQVIVQEVPQEKREVEVNLTTREKYNVLIEQYPLIKELRDRLKLELDY